MNSLQKTFLSMIKTALWDTPFVCEKGVETSDLFQEACRYEIAGVLSTKMDLFCPEDTKVQSEWSKKAMADYQKSSYILYAQTVLCDVLAKENIKPIFLKGIASAFYYPDPLLRQIGDIDFLVLPEQFETCCHLMEQNGYVKGVDNGRHIQFEKQATTYECHRFFSRNVTDAEKREDQIIYDGCKNCVKRSIQDKDFYTLPDAEYGLALLEHLKIHLIDGIGFRQIMDWVVYVDAVLNDDFWNSTFQKMVRECELEQMAKIFTRMAQIYLGLRRDNISWCSDIDDSVCEVLVGYIFSCNNFEFDEDSKNVHTVDRIFKTGFFANLDSYAVEHFPITKKVVVLRPFAWLYQIVRWGIHGIIGVVHAEKPVLSSMKEWQDQKELLKQMCQGDGFLDTPDI